MQVCKCKAVAMAAAAVGVYLIYAKLRKRKTEPKLQKKDWKEDTVYLYQFGRPKGMASVSPFCVKVEMFLRVNNIPYENVFVNSARSKYGLVPFVELNGVHFADSQLIMEKLKEHFNIKTLSDPREEAFARSLDRMADIHSFSVFMKYKALDNLLPFVRSVLESLNRTNLLPFAGILATHLFKPRLENRIFTSLGPFTNDEYGMLLKKDLDTFRDVLGDRKYLMGDEITPVDCTVFGQLATVCFLQYPTRMQELVREEYPTLVKYQERIIAQVFPTEFQA